MRAALVQFNASTVVEENLDRTESMLEEAKGRGADLVCLQECFNTYYGGSVIVDPIGEIVAQAGDGDEVLVADLPRERIEAVRKAWPFYRDRRPEAYGALVRP